MIATYIISNLSDEEAKIIGDKIKEIANKYDVNVETSIISTDESLKIEKAMSQTFHDQN